MENQSKMGKVMATLNSAKAKFTLYSETFFIALFIVNGVVATTMLFDLLEFSGQSRQITGGIVFAYTFIAFMYVVHRGVSQTKTRRK